MKKSLVFVVIAAVVFSGAALAKVQKGTIVIWRDGTWGCKGPGGVAIPQNSSGGWLALSPPRAVGGPCSGGARVVAGVAFGTEGVMSDAPDRHVAATRGLASQPEASAVASAPAATKPARAQEAKVLSGVESASGVSAQIARPTPACPHGVMPPCNDFGLPKFPGRPRD